MISASSGKADGVLAAIVVMLYMCLMAGVLTWLCGVPLIISGPMMLGFGAFGIYRLRVSTK